MKYNLTSSAKPSVPVATVQKQPITWEVAYEIMALNQRANKAADKIIAKDLEACEVFNNLTVAEILKESNALESLGDANLKDLADAFGSSVEAVKEMSLEDFCKRTDQLKPADFTSQESLAVVVGIWLAWYVAVIGISYVISKKMTKYEFWWDGNTDMLKILKEKGEKAIEEVVVDCFDKKEFDKQIVGCEKVLDFVQSKVDEIYGEKYKIADIEKMANLLWLCPDAITMTSGSNDVYGLTDDWFKGWTGAVPEHKLATLGKHGFNYKSLVDTCKKLVDFCENYNKIWELHGKIVNGKAEAKKAEFGDPGFFGKIKRFFTESKEDREKRKQAELILNAKQSAMRRLLWGYDWCIREMCGQFFSIAIKTEKYIRKAEPKK